MAPFIPISSALRGLMGSAFRALIGVALRALTGLVKGRMTVCDPTTPVVKALAGV